MLSPSKNRVLITGASSGIGHALARKFAKEGFPVFLVARRLERLKKLAASLPTDAKILGLDLTSPGSVNRIIDECGKETTILINNAGFEVCGEALRLDITDQLRQIDINVSALTDLTLSFAKKLQNEGTRGIILNISSVFSLYPVPYYAVYAASKAYVLHFSRALDFELSPYGIRVLTSCPGTTDTELHKGKKDNRVMMKPEAVANIIYIQVINTQSVLICGFQNKVVYNLLRFLPNWLRSSLFAKYLRINKPTKMN